MNDCYIWIGMIFIGVCVFIGLGLVFVIRFNGNGLVSSSVVILGKFDFLMVVVLMLYVGFNQIVVFIDIIGVLGCIINGFVEIFNYKFDFCVVGFDNVGIF